jgi:dihydrofolate reductase
MRRLVYSVAASLDGFIAGPTGEYDWIIQDPAFDFAGLWARFDALLMGRKTYEVAITRLESLNSMGKKIVVVSQTLDASKHSGATIIAADILGEIAKLKGEPGKDIWLMGGGVLFRTLLDAGLVDGVEVSLIPVLLGSGVPLIFEGRRCPLHLAESKALPSGILVLRYQMTACKTNG